MLEKIRKFASQLPDLFITNEAVQSVFSALGRNADVGLLRSVATQFLQSTVLRWKEQIAEAVGGGGTTGKGGLWKSLLYPGDKGEERLSIVLDILVSRCFPTSATLAAAWLLYKASAKKADIEAACVERLGETGKYLGQAIYAMGLFVEKSTEYVPPRRKRNLTADVNWSEVFSPGEREKRNDKAQKGQGIVEYALLILLVVLIVIAALMLLGPAIGDVFSSIGTVIATATPVR